MEGELASFQLKLFFSLLPAFVTTEFPLEPKPLDMNKGVPMQASAAREQRESN